MSAPATSGRSQLKIDTEHNWLLQCRALSLKRHLSLGAAAVRNLSLKWLFGLLTSFILIGFSVFSGFAWMRMEYLQINGPIYKSVVQGKDLVADILPPPVFIIEANLLAHQATFATSKDQAALMAQLEQVQKDFAARKQFWQSEGLQPETQSLLSAVESSAERYFASLNTRLVPALKTGETERTADILKDIQQDFIMHRRAVDALVTHLTSVNGHLEVEANEAIVDTRQQLIGMFFIIAILCFGAAQWARIKALALIGGELSTALYWVGRFSDGDLREQPTNVPVGSILEAFASLTTKINAVLRGIDGANREVGQSINQVMAVSKQISELSGNQQREADLVHQTTSQLEEGLNRVRQLAEDTQMRAHFAAGRAEKGLGAIAQIRANVQQAVEKVFNSEASMRELAAATGEIHSIVSSIKAIADQTNLLALNAAIEAARAGEQGRGFAVVADEVRTLATRTGEATAHITQLVGGLNAKVDATLLTMCQVAEVVTQVQRHSDENDESVKEIAQTAQRNHSASVEILQAAQDQLDNTQKLTHRINILFAVMKKNDTTLRVTSTISAALEKTMADLQGQIGFFKFVPVLLKDDHPNSRREHPRLRNTLMVMAGKPGAEKTQGVTMDFSLGGMRLVLPVEIGVKIHDNLELAVKPPVNQLNGYLNQAPIKLSGRVVRIHREGDEVHLGISFEDLDVSQQRELELVQSFYLAAA
jgi:methyl-accepting chemotaxis protein